MCNRVGLMICGFLLLSLQGGCIPLVPAQLCDDFVDSVCERAMECSDMTSEADCRDEVDQLIGCERTVGVSSGYDTCMDQVATDACEDLYPGGVLVLPPDCSGVILQ